MNKEAELKNKIYGMGIERGMKLENETIRYKEIKDLAKVLGKRLVWLDE